MTILTFEKTKAGRQKFLFICQLGPSQLLWTPSSTSCTGHLSGASLTSGTASGHRNWPSAVTCTASQIHPLLPPKKSGAVRRGFCQNGAGLKAYFNHTAFSIPVTTPGVFQCKRLRSPAPTPSEPSPFRTALTTPPEVQRKTRLLSTGADLRAHPPPWLFHTENSRSIQVPFSSPLSRLTRPCRSQPFIPFQ